MKKTFAIVFAALLLASAFVSCGKEEAAEPILDPNPVLDSSDDAASAEKETDVQFETPFAPPSGEIGEMPGNAEMPTPPTGEVDPSSDVTPPAGEDIVPPSDVFEPLPPADNENSPSINTPPQPRENGNTPTPPNGGNGEMPPSGNFNPTPDSEAPALTAEERMALASSFIGKSKAELIAAVGEPNDSSYASSCMGPGEDGELCYDGFTVVTYREGETETVEDVY